MFNEEIISNDHKFILLHITDSKLSSPTFDKMRECISVHVGQVMIYLFILFIIVTLDWDK